MATTDAEKTIYIPVPPKWKVTSERAGHQRIVDTGRPFVHDTANELRKILREKFGKKVHIVQSGAGYVLSNGQGNPTDVVVVCNPDIVDEVRKVAEKAIKEKY